MALNYFNVKDYGAVGNGIANNTRVLTSLVKALVAQNAAQVKKAKSG